MSVKATKVAPPPPKRSRLAQPPLPLHAPDNLSKPTDDGALQDMNFKVKPGFHRQFKLEASARDLSMKDFLEACFLAYTEKHGMLVRLDK